MQPNSMTVVLFQGDDLARANDLSAAVDAAAPPPGTASRQAGAVLPAECLEALAAYDEFVGGDADARALKVTVQALPRKKWRDLVTRYPVREDEEQDAQAGFNVDEGGETLVLWSLAGITDAGKKVQPPKRAEVVDALSDGQFFQVLSACVRLNIDAAPAPKADLSSRVTLLYDAMSRSPSASV